MAKTNDKRRRKNWLRRVVRGSVKAGRPLPGYSRIYMDGTPLDAAYTVRGELLRDEVSTIAQSMGGTLPKARTHTTPNRWF